MFQVPPINHLKPLILSFIAIHHSLKDETSQWLQHHSHLIIVIDCDDGTESISTAIDQKKKLYVHRACIHHHIMKVGTFFKCSPLGRTESKCCCTFPSRCSIRRILSYCCCCSVSSQQILFCTLFHSIPIWSFSYSSNIDTESRYLLVVCLLPILNRFAACNESPTSTVIAV